MDSVRYVTTPSIYDPFRPGFCPDAFLDLNKTWYTHNPKLSECFLQTFLVWLPCAFFWLVIPMRLFCATRTDTKGTFTCLSSSKMVILFLLIVTGIFEFGYELASQMSDYNLVVTADIVAPIVKLVTMIGVGVCTYIERRKGSRINGSMFIFWLIMLGASSVAAWSVLIRFYNGDLAIDVIPVLHLIWFLLVLSQFVLACWYHGPSKTDSENGNPSEHASFLNNLTYWWVNGIMYQGWKKPLVQEDLHDIIRDDRAQVLVGPLQANWDREMNGFKRSRQLGDKNSAKPSFAGALFRTYWKTLLFTGLLRLAGDLLGFTLPFLLRRIVNFLLNNEEEIWKGYLNAVILLVIMVIQTLTVNWYLYVCNRTGMLVKNAITAMIYRKALRITSAAKHASSVGEIVNLMSVDTARFMEFLAFIHTLWSSPFVIAVSMYFLYGIFGAAMFAGLITLALLMPLNAYVWSQMRMVQGLQMKEKDRRIKLLSEILNGIKVLKLYAWEEAFQRELLSIRNRELIILKRSAYWAAASHGLFTSATYVLALAMFVAYALLNPENILNATVLFPALAWLNLIRQPMGRMCPAVGQAIQIILAQKRLLRFFQNEELDPDNVIKLDPSIASDVRITDGTLTWDAENKSPCLRNINLDVSAGELIAVVGKIGSGKSSLCGAMIGLLKKTSGTVGLKGKVAYVSQQAWIQNMTIQENILFGSEMKRASYNTIVKACALITDLDALPGGDQTQIGERGINLSGGQKQRLSLARAAYSDADIYILDDPLSAVDAHVGKHIFDNVIGPNGILKDKTRILVTHGIAFLSQTDRIVVLTNGSISEEGTYQKLVENDGEFAVLINTYLNEKNQEVLEEQVDTELMEEIEIEPGEGFGLASLQGTSSRSSLRRVKSMLRRGVTTSPLNVEEAGRAKGKLMEEEKQEIGAVKWDVYLLYAKHMSLSATVLLVFLHTVYSTLASVVNFWLADWPSDQDYPDRRGTNWRDYRIGVYSGIVALQGVFIAVFSFTMAQARIRASRNIHEELLTRILHCPMSFFDTTPLGRVMTRFGRDVDIVDILIPSNIEFGLFSVLSVLTTVVVICVSTPPFATIIIPLAVLYFFMQRFYSSVCRQLKRIEATERSPLISHFQESMAGTPVIIASNQTDKFIRQNEALIDRSNASTFLIVASNRWITLRMEMIGILATFLASMFAVMSRQYQWGISPEAIGLSITYALQINILLNWLLWISCELESNIVSVERIKEYTQVPQEAPWRIPETKPPENWPERGEISFIDHQARYRDDLDLILKGLTADIEGGEKVGVVGRTGAGKSSLTLSLFRIIEPAGGKIVIDGVDISKLGLHDLRSRLTILPQEPVLFTGLLRMNLDPFEIHTDAELWDALAHSHLRGFVSSLPDGLMSKVVDGGENYSVGQRQLICLARALLRKTKILVLDEATAAVDLHTDDLIQRTIRDKFADCTILTIAHRINTIMDSNRIMVLDQGRVKEYAAPAQLLEDKTSVFYGLAQTSHLTACETR